MTEQEKTRTNQHLTDCRRCEKPIMRGDEWWAHRWEEKPNEETVEKAIEDPDFRDWFQENIVLCSSCHKKVVEVIRDD